MVLHADVREAVKKKFRKFWPQMFGGNDTQTASESKQIMLFCDTSISISYIYIYKYHMGTPTVLGGGPRWRSWAERRQKLMTSARTCNVVGSDKIPLANKFAHPSNNIEKNFWEEWS